MEEINLGDITLTRYFMLYLEDYETAVMADFHLGYEDVMAQKGVFLPKLQYPYIMDILEKIFERYDPRSFIIDGDLKHEFSRNMPQEWKEIESVVDFIRDRSKLTVVRGNHDNFLRSILKRREVPLVDSFVLGNYVFAHGHRYLDVPEGKTLIMGHEHPSITLRDEIYASAKYPCFLLTSKLIVLPASSLYAYGTDITRNDYISPILRTTSPDFEIFVIDEREGLVALGKMHGEKFI